MRKHALAGFLDSVVVSHGERAPVQVSPGCRKGYPAVETSTSAVEMGIRLILKLEKEMRPGVARPQVKGKSYLISYLPVPLNVT